MRHVFRYVLLGVFAGQSDLHLWLMRGWSGAMGGCAVQRFIISMNFLQAACLFQKQQHRYLTCSLSSRAWKTSILLQGVGEHLFIFKSG